MLKDWDLVTCYECETKIARCLSVSVMHPEGGLVWLCDDCANIKLNYEKYSLARKDGTK